MKYLKLYETYFKKENIDIQKVCDLYEDVKSIGYILEDLGIEPKYILRVVCIPDGTLQKEIRLYGITNVDQIREILMRPKFNLESFVISAENFKEVDKLNRWSPVNKVCSEVEFDEHLTKYLSLLKEHLDYVDESFIRVEGWRPPQRKDIIISKEYFK
mgnify:CR=1 FL=1